MDIDRTIFYRRQINRDYPIDITQTTRSFDTNLPAHYELQTHDRTQTSKTLNCVILGSRYNCTIRMPKTFNRTLRRNYSTHSLFRKAIYSIAIFHLIIQHVYVQCTSISALNEKIPPSQMGANCNYEDHHEIIKPMFLVRNFKPKSLSLESCPDNMIIRFSSYGNEFVIDLVKNKRLISDRYFKIIDQVPIISNTLNSSVRSEEFYKNHKFLHLNTTNDDHCHYQGIVNKNLNSFSAISVVNRNLLSGFFHDGSNSYQLKANMDNSTTILMREICLNPAHPTPVRQYSAALISPVPESNSQTRSRFRRRVNSGQATSRTRRTDSQSPDNRVLHEPFQSNVNSLYVELLIVHDHSQFTEYNRNTSMIAERTMQIVNIMNAYYRQLNIFIALVGVVLWTEKDEIVLTEDGDSTLTNFLKYRYEKLLPRYHHDNAQLITSTSFNGSVVGKALKGPICTHDHSGGVNTDHSHSPAIVAVTLAHELGHNLGMEHDEEDKCKCPDEKCIMSSSSSTVHPKHWSSCSIEYLEDSRKHGLLDCLRNEPKSVFGPICGNGFVEEGEDCDLGEAIPSYRTSKSRNKSISKCGRGQDCTPEQVSQANPCCDRSTCKFVGNATCAQGACCDLSSCSVYNGTEPKICRQRKTECDLEEVCDGKSEHCPSDVHYHDGIECGLTPSINGLNQIVGSATYNRSRAYCYQGRCASHESQCQLLWGPSGSTSKDICYEQNIHGNTSGNCGYNRVDKSYEDCEPDNAICGMLHCVHNQPSDSRKTGKLGYGFESASILTVSFFVMSSHAKIFCHGAIIDAGPNIRDPGLVPNGAACGDDRMCVDQKCVPVQEVVYKNWCSSDCNGNGICDNMGVCHCNDGTIGTSCYQFFGANFHLSLVLYIIMFFGPIIALIVFAINHYRRQIKIWWFLHNRKVALRNKVRVPLQQRRIPLDSNGQKISISEPIPLSQHANSNRPLNESTNNPWNETNCETSKSPGYRLEPLKKLPETPFGNGVARPSGVSNMVPVRSAPPPPIPPHKHQMKS